MKKKWEIGRRTHDNKMHEGKIKQHVHLICLSCIYSFINMHEIKQHVYSTSNMHDIQYQYSYNIHNIHRLFKQGHYLEALEKYTLALQHCPTSDEMNMNRVRLYCYNINNILISYRVFFSIIVLCAHSILNDMKNPLMIVHSPSIFLLNT